MRKGNPLGRIATAIAVGAMAIALALVLLKPGFGQPASSTPPGASVNTTNAAPAPATVDLAPSQTNAIKIAPLGTAAFSVDKMAIGSIDYDEDLSVQVFSPYPGKIISTFASLGDDVKKGQALYSINSPDLAQAESTLIGTSASVVLYSNELARAADLFKTNGVSQREYEQASSDAQTAEGSYKAARGVVRIFGKSDAEIDQIIAEQKVDSVLVVSSPVKGRVTARNAQPGLLVQPGSVPAPYAVADLATKWIVANVTESDSQWVRVGQPVQARITALAGRVFASKISAQSTAVDPTTHRRMVRCEIADPGNELLPGMLASMVIQVQEPVESVAIPMNGVVRNGDGTMAAWVTTDRHRFTQRMVKIGLQRDGLWQVLEGLRPGELAVTDGAVFISNILYAPPAD
jgi:cobalt-zinc-cadmium efflux system membrane fusion protein